MNNIEFFPYHNKHIKFKDIDTGKSVSGVVFDMPWEEKNGVSTNYYFVPTENLSEYNALEGNKDKQKELRQTIDIKKIEDVDFFDYSMSQTELKKLDGSILENIHFFLKMFEKDGNKNESFFEYMLRFERTCLNEFDRFSKIIIKDIVKDYNDAYSNPESTFAKKLGFSFALKEFGNKDFAGMEQDESPFIQIRFNKWTQDFSNSNLPFLHFECLSKTGKVLVILKPNLSSTGIIKIGEFPLYDKIIINQIEDYFFQFLQKVAPQQMSYA